MRPRCRPVPVAHLIKQEFNVRYHEGHVWKILVGLGWSPQRPEGRARERNEEQILELEEEGLARTKKKARREGRILVFIDESGLSQQAHRCRTWAPRGQTPILQYNFNWKSLSVAAGLTLLELLFSNLCRDHSRGTGGGLFEGLDASPLDQPLLIVWDRLPEPHHSRLVQD